jgi:RNA-splicing ligase RtcB
MEQIVTGTYNSAKVFTDVVEEEALRQIQTLCDQPFTQGAQIRIMPDVHAGAGCTIGTTMTVTDTAVPNLVGVDIGCGMEVLKVKNKFMEVQKLDKLIRAAIPAGFHIRGSAHAFAEEIDLSELHCAGKVDIGKAYRSLGTLGGGNHFIEADKDADGGIYLVIHSGSRHLGLEVATYYQKCAWKSLNAAPQDEVRRLIASYKEQGRDTEIEAALEVLKGGLTVDVPQSLAYVSGSLFESYMHDMAIVQRFAMLSRQAMMDEIIRGMKLKTDGQFTTVHNYIDTENMILRKGAVSARAGERLIIPLNMRDGCLLCTGKGNPDWNQSAPHGAGRLMSRKKARESFTVSAFRKEMAGVYTTSVSAETLDECPMAYKRMEDILDNIAPTVTVDRVIKPIYSFKAGEEYR